MTEDRNSIYEQWGAERNILSHVDEALFSVAKSTRDERVKHILEKAAGNMVGQVACYREIFQNERVRRVQEGLDSDYQIVAGALLTQAAFNPQNVEEEQPSTPSLYPDAMIIDLREQLPTEVTQLLLRRLHVFIHGEQLASLRKDPEKIDPYTGIWRLPNLESPLLMGGKVNLIGNSGQSYGTYRVALSFPQESANSILTTAPLYTRFNVGKPSQLRS